jgi:alanine dehydrogenase
MIVGIPKEIKNNENRVSLTPAGAHELVQRGHTVYIQHTAGINSGLVKPLKCDNYDSRNS